MLIITNFNVQSFLLSLNDFFDQSKYVPWTDRHREHSETDKEIEKEIDQDTHTHTHTHTNTHKERDNEKDRQKRQLDRRDS
jgi:hypothetical protein